jgi:hypothetical protein
MLPTPEAEGNMEWIPISDIVKVISWISDWYKAKSKPKDFSELIKYLSLRELYLIRCMNEWGAPHYASHFGHALANWDDEQNNKGWEKAAEYACKNLAMLGIVQPAGSEVELTALGKALINEERDKARSRAVFEKPLPSYKTHKA